MKKSEEYKQILKTSQYFFEKGDLVKAIKYLEKAGEFVISEMRRLTPKGDLNQPNNPML